MTWCRHIAGRHNGIVERLQHAIGGRSSTSCVSEDKTREPEIYSGFVSCCPRHRAKCAGTHEALLAASKGCPKSRFAVILRIHRAEESGRGRSTRPGENQPALPPRSWFRKSHRADQPPKVFQDATWSYPKSRDPRFGLPWSSMRFISFVFHPRVCRHPVDFPSLASIFRKRLFKAARIRGDVRYHKSNKNRSPVQCFLVEKLTPPILELADRGLA